MNKVRSSPLIISNDVRSFVHAHIDNTELRVDFLCKDGSACCRQYHDEHDVSVICMCCGPELFRLLYELGEDTYPHYSKRAVGRLRDYCFMETLHLCYQTEFDFGACCPVLTDRESPYKLLCTMCDGHMIGIMDHITMRATLDRRMGIPSNLPRDLHWVLLRPLCEVVKGSEIVWSECKTHLWL